MAISKQEARKAGNSFNEDEVERLERKIDQSLLEGGSGAFSVDIFSHLSGAGQAEIFRRYEAAGWKIEYISDWRDGDYYQFR